MTFSHGASARRILAAVAFLVGCVVGASLIARDRADPDAYTAGACELDAEILSRIERGYRPDRSNDVTFVPREPNFVGSFTLTSHSGPWDYVQNVPLVLYGPRYVPSVGRSEAEADLAGVYPTVARWLGLDLPPVDGAVLPGAVSDGSAESPPKLVMVVVWDGAGRRTLEAWPNDWPTLRRMEENGTSYVDATVGSSPSVTSATHSTLGTGTYPRRHGITGNDLRMADGRVVEAFESLSTENLLVPTFADLVDREFDNESEVGLLAWVRWHVGMLGHGTALEGGDPDEMALIGYRDEVFVRGNERLFDVPSGISTAADIGAFIEDLDRKDGVVDGKWLGNEIELPDGIAPWDTYSNPAWVRYQTKLALYMLRRGAYGQDDVPDLFLTNFKMTDLAGHSWGIESRETQENLRAQDAALAEILRFLDRKIEDYVVVVTADHGASPLPSETGAWPISQDELIRDLDDAFAVAQEQTLVEASSAWGLFLDREVAEGHSVSPEDVAGFLSEYTIRQNWPEESLPDGYEQRGDEPVMSAAFPTAEIDELKDRCT